MLGAAVLRVYQLGAHPLWMDEIFTAIFTDPQNDLGTVIALGFSDSVPNPPLLFTVLYALQKLFGPDPFVLRIFSAITGTLAVFVLYKLGELFFGRRVGLISALLLTIAPLHIFHSREARYYGAVILFSLLSMYFLHRGLATDRKTWWLGFTLAMLANLYTHLSALFVLGLESVYVLYLFVLDARWFKGQAPGRLSYHPQALRSFVVSLGAVVLLALPLVPPVLDWVLVQNAFGAEQATVGFQLRFQFFFKLFSEFAGSRGVIASLYASAFLVGIAATWGRYRRANIFLLLAMSLPFITVQLLNPEHPFWTRYVIFLLPLFLLWVALGLDNLAEAVGTLVQDRAGWAGGAVVLRLILLAAVVLLSTDGTVQALSPQIDHVQEISTFLESNVGSEDAIALFPLQIGTLETDRFLRFLAAIPESMEMRVVADSAQLQELSRQHAHVWLVADRYQEHAISRPVLEWVLEQPNLEIRFDERDRVYYLGGDSTTDALITESLSFKSTNAGVHASLGSTYALQGLWAESAAAYQRAIQLDPKEADWHYQLGLAYQEQGQPEEAIRACLQAIALDTKVAGYHAALGTLYRRADRYTEALAAYEEAIRLWQAQTGGSDQDPYLEAWLLAVEELRAAIE